MPQLFYIYKLSYILIKKKQIQKKPQRQTSQDVKVGLCSIKMWLSELMVQKQSKKDWKNPLTIISQILLNHWGTLQLVWKLSQLYLNV